MSILFNITKIIMPLLVFIFSLILLFSEKNLADSFVLGAKQGAKCCFELLPTLLLMMCAVSALFSSGGVDLICNLLRLALLYIGVPEKLLPAIILRPFSGSAVTVVADKIFSQTGPDSEESKILCLIMGSTDTIIYTLGMYFSAVKTKKTRYALPASVIVFIFSIFICNFVGKLLF